MKKSIRNEHVDAICELWEKDTLWKSTWMGFPAIKNPVDAWIYQEIIFETKPDLIIETGSFKGGSALFFANMFDLLGNGRVISIDTKGYDKPEHQRIKWLTGSSTQSDLVSHVRKEARDRKVMLILDSDHEAGHVLGELRSYADLVPKGGYIVVEDTWWKPGNGGPWDAVQEFLSDRTDFEIDKSRERYLMTNNPNGFLKRI